MFTPETYSPAETAILDQHFTNTNLPVFALVNLPEAVKAAMFARYSRTSKPLRRLFLDEFAEDITNPAVWDGAEGARAEGLMNRVFVQYGDDSVAQLGGAHLACEGMSNILTKVVQWGRLAAYLEQSTRYLPYNLKTDGKYRYYRDPNIMGSDLAGEYEDGLDEMFDIYTDLLERLPAKLAEAHPKPDGISDVAYQNSVKARAFDALRGLLPAAALSNVGVYANGQAYESLIMRLQSHPLPEAREYGAMILTELRKVIPSFLRRVDIPDRGVEWSDYQRERHDATAALAAQLFDGRSEQSIATVRLIDFDPRAETRMIAAMLAPYTHLSDHTLMGEVDVMSQAEKQAVIDVYVGERNNRRHKPGRALERVNYRFEIVADYGSFRDLQRHRTMTIEWQPLTPFHGYNVPADIAEHGMGLKYARAMDESARVHDLVAQKFPAQASYSIALGYRVRFVMGMNARAAMHTIELRSGPSGHEGYRHVAQEMFRTIEDTAGHHMIARMLSHTDHSGSGRLGRLDAENRTAAKRAAAPPG